MNVVRSLPMRFSVITVLASGALLLGCPAELDFPAGGAGSGTTSSSTTISTTGTGGGTGGTPVQLTGAPLWAHNYGDGDEQAGTSVAVDPQGGIYVAGSFAGTIDFGSQPLTSAGNHDVFIAKLDPTDGHRLWSRRIGDTAEQNGAGIAFAAGSIAVTGSFGGTIDFGKGGLTSAGGTDIFVAKLDANGAALWSRSFGSVDNDVGLGVAMDAAGDVVVTGSFHGSVDFGGGAFHAPGAAPAIVVAKLDATDGHTLWARTMGTDTGNGAGNGIALAVASDGSILLGGVSFGTIDFGGGPIPNASGACGFITRMGADGAYQWGKLLQASNGSNTTSVAGDSAGNVYLTGTYIGTADLGGGPMTAASSGSSFLVSFDSSGGYRWQKTIGESYDGAAVAVAGEHVVATGYFTSPTDLGAGTVQPDASGGSMYLVKLDASGAHVWDHAFAAGPLLRPMSAAGDAAGNVVVAGALNVPSDFGKGMLTPHGQDALVAKWAP
jgi:hypothetical protein